MLRASSPADRFAVRFPARTEELALLLRGLEDPRAGDPRTISAPAPVLNIRLDGKRHVIDDAGHRRRASAREEEKAVYIGIGSVLAIVLIIILLVIVF